MAKVRALIRLKVYGIGSLMTLDVLQPMTEHPSFKDSDRDPKDLSLKTIKRGRAGPVFSFRGQEVLGFTAVQDAIG